MLKYASTKSENKISVLLVNYLVATLLGSFMMGGRIINVVNNKEYYLIILGVFTGFIYVVNFLLLQLSIRKNGATVTASMVHIGVAIPIFFSVFLFNEIPTGLQLAGIGVTCITLFVVSYTKKTDANEQSSRWILVLLVMGYGVGNLTSKIFDVKCNHDNESVFFWIVYIVALIVCFIVSRSKHEKINKYDIICGAATGIINYFSSVTMVRALYTIPSFVAYIFTGLGSIVFVNIINLLFLHEKLVLKDYIAMVLAIGAVILLQAAP